MHAEKQRFQVTPCVKAFAMLGILVITFLLYANTLHAPFAFDDPRTIIENKNLRSYSILSQWNTSRYIGYLTFALNYRFNKLEPFGYHIINVLIHALNGILVFILTGAFLRILKPDSSKEQNFFLSLITSLLFVLHPIQTQTVTYTSQRFASLAAFFVLLSIYCFIRFRMDGSTSPRIFYVLSLICAFLAFKTKENTATLPFMILLLERLLFRSSTSLRRLLAVIPFFFLLFVIIISFISIEKPLGSILQDSVDKSAETHDISRTTYLMTQFRVLTTYVRLLLFPIHQSIDYYYPLSESFFELRTFASFLFVLSLLIVAITIRRTYPAVSFGLLWFFIFLLVESSIIPIADVIFEHRLYLPSVGFFFALTSFIFEILHRQHALASSGSKSCPCRSSDNKQGNSGVSRKKKRSSISSGSRHAVALATIGWRAFGIMASVFGILLIILAVLTYQRNRIWNDNVALWKDVVTQFPENPRGHINLGSILSSHNRCDEAIPELLKGLKYQPSNPTAHSELSFCYWIDQNAGPDRLRLALQERELALRLDPLNTDYYFNYALLLMDIGRINDAISALEKAKKSDPTDIQFLFFLGKAYCQAGNIQSALSNFQQALSLAPNSAETHLELGVCLLQNNQIDAAHQELLTALQLKPDLTNAHYYLGLSFEKQSNFRAAYEQYELFRSKASADNPFLPDAIRHQQTLK